MVLDKELKNYSSPYVEIEMFTVYDIISTSSSGSQDDNEDEGGLESGDGTIDAIIFDKDSKDVLGIIDSNGDTYAPDTFNENY